MSSHRRSVGSIRYLQRYWVLIVWIFLTSIIFFKTYRDYKTKPQFYYLHEMLGCWLCISRGSAPVITMCSFLVVLPVCRSLHTLVYKLLAKFSRKPPTWLSNVKVAHMLCAITLIFFALLHTGAHIMNAINFSKHYTVLYPDINLAKYKGQNPAILICNWTGFTGILMLLLLIAIGVSSSSKFRSKHFNLFYIVHLSFVCYFLLMLMHPLSGVLKEQSNYNEHVPGCEFHKNSSVKERFVEERVEHCSTPPNFRCIPTQSWIWIVVTLFIYLLEISYRKYCGYTLEAIQLCPVPKSGVHLRLKTPTNFIIEPGQYVLLQCSRISNIEWHPFTVTRCPSKEEESIDVLISIRGDWTQQLQLIANNPYAFNPSTKYIHKMYHESLKFVMNGPFASSMQTIIHREVVVCVAAGVGITSYVASLVYLLNNTTENPKRLHLLWLTRNPYQLMWYTKLFCDLKNKFWNSNKPDRFDFQLFITKENISYKHLFKDPLVENRIRTGRPNWKREFLLWNSLYKSNIYLYICGPKSLKRELKSHCLKANKGGSKISFITEGF